MYFKFLLQIFRKLTSLGLTEEFEKKLLVRCAKHFHNREISFSNSHIFLIMKHKFDLKPRHLRIIDFKLELQEFLK